MDIKISIFLKIVLAFLQNWCLLNDVVSDSASCMRGGRIAQSVEQRTENPRVPSSILGPATIFFYLNLMIFLLK